MTIEKLMEAKEQLERESDPIVGVICHPDILYDIETENIDHVEVDENLSTMFEGCPVSTNKAVPKGKFVPCYSRYSFAVLSQLQEKSMEYFLEYIDEI